MFQSRFWHDLSAPTSPATVPAVEHSGAGEQHLSTIKPYVKITGRGKVLHGGKKPWCPNLEKMREGVEVTGRWWGQFSLQIDCLVTHRGCPPPLSSQVNNRTKQWTKTARRGWVSESRYSKSIAIYQCHNRPFVLAKHTENTQCTHINYDRRQTGKGIEIDLLWL